MTTQLIAMEEFASVQQAQAGITKLFARAKNKGKFVRVMRNQNPLGVLVPNSLWESIIEDLEALSSPNYLHAISEARNNKKVYSAGSVKKMLGL